MRVALNARVSTLNGQAPEMQLRELREYAARRGWEVCGEYPSFREIILEELRMPTTTIYYPEVVSPFYTRGNGDLDLILCPPWSPSEAFALECKHV